MSVRIAVLNKENKVVGFLDNNCTNAIPYFDDELTEYVKGSASKFEFTAKADADKNNIIVEGNHLAFISNGNHFFTIVQIEEDSSEIRATCYSSSFELLNSEVEGREAVTGTIEDVFRAFNLFNFCTLGIVETGEIVTADYDEETILSRLFSIADNYGMEVEIKPIIGVFHSLIELRIDFVESIGKGSMLQVVPESSYTNLKVGADVDVLRRSADVTETMTAVKVFSNVDNVYRDLRFYEKSFVGADGTLFFTEYGDDYVYAVDYMEKFPTLVTFDKYIKGYEEAKGTTNEELFFEAVAVLQEKGVPKVSYEIDVVKLPKFLGIGQYVFIEDDKFTPPLKLKSRVYEKKTSFTDSSKKSIKLSNVTELITQ